MYRFKLCPKYIFCLTFLGHQPSVPINTAGAALMETHDDWRFIWRLKFVTRYRRLALWSDGSCNNNTGRHGTAARYLCRYFNRANELHVPRKDYWLQGNLVPVTLRAESARESVFSAAPLALFGILRLSYCAVEKGAYHRQVDVRFRFETEEKKMNVNWSECDVWRSSSRWSEFELK